MAANKTTPNSNSVSEFIASLDDVQQQADSQTLVEMFQRVSGEKPVMWGDAIIGFGHAKLVYASGREVDWPTIGFSPRKGKIALYVTFAADGLTSQFPDLGKCQIAKGCIYIKRLSDVNIDELEKLVKVAYDAGWQSPNRADGKEQIVSKK